jgi:hypothetical protein
VNETFEAIASTGFDFGGPANILLVFNHVGTAPEAHVLDVGTDYTITCVILRHPAADAMVSRKLVYMHGQSRVTADNAQVAMDQHDVTPIQIWAEFVSDVLFNVAQCQATQFQELCEAVAFDPFPILGSPTDCTPDEMVTRIQAADAVLRDKLLQRRLDNITATAMDPDIQDQVPADEIDAMVRAADIARKMLAGTATNEEKQEALTYLAKYGLQPGAQS